MKGTGVTSVLKCDKKTVIYRKTPNLVDWELRRGKSPQEPALRGKNINCNWHMAEGSVWVSSRIKLLSRNSAVP